MGKKKLYQSNAEKVSPERRERYNEYIKKGIGAGYGKEKGFVKGRKFEDSPSDVKKFRGSERAWMDSQDDEEKGKGLTVPVGNNDVHVEARDYEEFQKKLKKKMQDIKSREDKSRATMKHGTR